ncbi:hypothetical protein FSP39_013253 [Pinctada imbricata]|uniref:Uncharacterized protein n=1 Tax=Pinctada imbricata TaxID=66713 RepID=A0AA88XFH3_PINIB|nr:hypothetical protein FSP39_013253 [Pinctada imbricata]
MASNVNVESARLQDLSHDFYANYMKKESVSLKSKHQGYKYFSEGYFHDVSMFKEENSLISISAKSYRSQRKSEKPHALHLGVQNVDIKYANCTCQAGKIKVERSDINHLKSLTGVPISYLVATPDEMIDNHVGSVPIASGLSTHVRTKFTFL